MHSTVAALAGSAENFKSSSQTIQLGQLAVSNLRLLIICIIGSLYYLLIKRETHIENKSVTRPTFFSRRQRLFLLMGDFEVDISLTLLS
jgi:hypothetical protein